MIKPINLFFLLFLFSLSCKKNKVQLSPQKAITSFELKISFNPGLTKDIRGLIVGDTIKLAVPSTADLSKLVPSITYKGASISPSNELAQDFSNPVIYIIKAEDESIKKYIVVVRFLKTTKEILSFAFKATNNANSLMEDAIGVINNDTITIKIGAFNVVSLVPAITHNGSQITPSDNQSQSFVNPVTYTVTAEDGSVRKYVVIVHTNASLFVGGMDSTLYAFDAGTGKVRWKYKLDKSVDENPTYANGKVYIGNDKNFYAINSISGELVWKTSLPGVVSTSPQIVDNTVYIALSAPSMMAAIDATNGNIKWETTISSSVVIGCNPTVADGRVVVAASLSNYLNCLDAETGVLLWTFDIGHVIRCNPLVVNGTLYMGSYSYKLVAIDMATGIKKWTVPTYEDFTDGIGSDPTMYNGVLYTGGGGFNCMGSGNRRY